MESKMKIACILVLYFLQLCLPVQSVDCDGTCAITARSGVCYRDVCYCDANFAGATCGDPVICAARAACTGDEVCAAGSICKSCHADCKTNGGSCHAVVDDVRCKCVPTQAGDNCEYTCSPACTGDNVCRETPAGGAAECVKKCTDAASCSAKGTCDEETCTCNANQAGDDCSIACSPTCDSTKEVCQKTGATTAECLVDCNKAGTPCDVGGTCTDGVCDCAANKAGKFCQLACDPGCTGGKKCRETAAGGAAICVSTCTNGDASTCSDKGTCADDICTCDPDYGGEDCGIECSAECTTKEICQQTGEDLAECLVDCNKAGTPCAAGGSCTNGVCTCAANKAGKFCQLDCDPVCAAGTECKENAAGDDGECSGASALLATWIIFLAAAFSFI